MAKLNPMAWGSSKMSQPDIMGSAMNKAFRNTKVFGTPMKTTTPKMPKLRGAAKRSRATKAASKLFGGL